MKHNNKKKFYGLIKKNVNDTLCWSINKSMEEQFGTVVELYANSKSSDLYHSLCLDKTMKDEYKKHYFVWHKKHFEWIMLEKEYIKMKLELLESCPNG